MELAGGAATADDAAPPAFKALGGPMAPRLVGAIGPPGRGGIGTATVVVELAGGGAIASSLSGDGGGGRKPQ